jgi:putative zinc finger/helix-turn-helix YgiT family protein
MSNELCAICGAEARLIREEREVPVGHLRTRVLDEYYRCESCAEEYHTAEQAEAVERRAIERLHEENRLLLPEEIRAIRKGLGLTQSAFEELLGMGSTTASRWEHGHVIPNASADALLRLIRTNRENARLLAEWRGVELPSAA